MIKCLRMPKLSILIPIYYNEQNLPTTIPELLHTVRMLPPDMESELIFVDDGSRDGSFAILERAAQNDPRIKVIRLSRNFGAYMALLAGLEAATGDCISVIMADLQDPPELIPQMVNEWRTGHKIVIASRTVREDAFVDRIFASLFWRFMKRFALHDLPTGGFDFILFDRAAADVVRRAREKNSHFMLQVFQTGFPFKEIPYMRRQRRAGTSRWTFSKKLKLFIDSSIAFSYIPIRLMSVIGIITAIIGFLTAAYYTFYWLLYGIDIQGWTSIMVAVLVLGGLQMVMLGMIGEYIWRTYDESRRRPPYVVSETINLKATTPDDIRSASSV